MSSSVVSVQAEIISLCKNLQKFKQFSFFFQEQGYSIVPGARLWLWKVYFYL